MARPVQFRNTAAIMQAFVNSDVKAWAVFSDKQLLSKAVGDTLEESRQILEGLLKSMEKSNTSAIYTLCLYEDIKERRKIKISTEPDFSYNFTLFDNDEYPAPGTVTRREGYARLEDKLETLQAQIALMVKGDEEEDDDETVGKPASGWLGAIDKILDNPKVQEKLGEKLMGWFDQLLTSTPATMQSPKQIGAMGSTGDAAPPGPITEITQDQYDKINSSIAILASIDPQLGDHLAAIAKLAREKPQKYKNLITMLNTFL